MSSTTQPRMISPSQPQPVWPYRLPAGCNRPGQQNPEFFQTDPTKAGPISERWLRLSQHVHGSTDMRPAEWQPQQYPMGFQTDPTYWMRYPYWGSNYIYYRPYFQSPTGACMTDNKCIEGVAASGCMNFDNSKANAFYSGKTCSQVQKILNVPAAVSPSGASCQAQPKGCWA